MGKRKSSSKPQGPKKREPLSTQFTCLFCNHEKAVNVKIDKKAGVGQLYCKVCGQKFQSNTNYLSHAVDVYTDWIDACESVAQEAATRDAEDRKFSSYATERERPAAAASSSATKTGASGGGAAGASTGAGASRGGAAARIPDEDDLDDDAGYDDDY